MKALMAELVGTFALVFIGAGSICTDSLTSGGIGLLGIALAHAVVLSIMVSCCMYISGSHFNPAVTIAIWSLKKISGKTALRYILFQVLGAIIAAILLIIIFPKDSWEPVFLGTPTLGPSISFASGVLVEAILTFFLVFAILATAVDPKGPKQLSGFSIGLVLLFDILMGGPLTGAAMNPARALGPALISGSWSAHLVYWVGPIFGSLVAVFVYTYLSTADKK